MSQTTIVVAENTPPAEGTAATPAAETPAAGDAGHTTESTGHEGGQQGPFPPMDATTFPSQIFWLVIFFALLYLLMSKLALPKMAAVLAKRHKALEGDLGVTADGEEPWLGAGTGLEEGVGHDHLFGVAVRDLLHPGHDRPVVDSEQVEHLPPLGGAGREQYPECSGSIHRSGELWGRGRSGRSGIRRLRETRSRSRAPRIHLSPSRGPC